MTAYDKNEAQQDLARRQNLPVVGGIYEHYKGGLYVVLAVGIDMATGVPTVAYRSNRANETWSCPLEIFQSDAPGGGPESKRFARVDR